MKFNICIPVFNVKDAWKAIKIADDKLKAMGENIIKNITCSSVVPIENNYYCIFTFNSDHTKLELSKKLKWQICEVNHNDG